ncbi:hypothetical protein [Ruthenibacterium lactatiformans]|uniref:hypothetical protein n=1 Tax=Ruthenibacterium lactatiformans TaxID=1550024 RepID=UPI00067855EC|nr:hypothetical protein [Ruthenibacterium lactatiformans]
MNRYLCKCGRAVNKSTNADNTGNRETEGCEGCPYLMPWGATEWDHTRHAMVMDVKGYECRMSPTLEYRTELHGHLDDKTTIRIISLDFDFLERVSDWVKEHYPNGELSGGFSRDRIRPAEYVDEGRYRYTLACSQNKKGIAAKRALWAEFFDETFHRKDMDADAEKQKILRDIEQGKAAAHKDAAEMDKETNAMLIYRDPATGWLYRVSPQPEHGSYVMQYRDPANSATWKWCANWNIGNIYRESLEEVLEARAKRDGWELVSGPASSEPPEVVDEGEEYSPCDTCRCPDCIESSCPQAGCDKTDGGFGCFAPYEECPAPAEETCPDERLEKEVGKCKNQSVPNGDAAATTAGSAAPEPAETSTTPTDANTLPAPGCPADAGSATQSLSAAGPASLEAEPEATPFDYSGLDAQTVATLHSAENIIRSARKEYVIKVADAVGMAHDELVANCDKRGNQYSENTFRAWCASVGIGKDAAYRLLQVSNLLESSTPNEQKILKQASPSLLYAAARPSAEPEAVEALKGGDITTHKQYRELEARLKAEREAREKATAEAERLRYANDALRDEAATARAQAKHAQEKADALETRPVISELFDAKERIKELEARPVEVAVQEPDPAEVERRAGEKAREMTSMLQAQVRGMQEDLDDARKIIDSAESATYMAAAEFAVNAAQVLNGIRASFWAVAKELSDDDFSSAAAPLLEAARKILDCEWDDDEEEQE